MERYAANIISYVFHPLLMPLAGLFIITHSGTYAGILDYRLQRVISILVFGFTFALPAAFIPLYYYTKLVKSITMRERRDRIIPYYITLIFYLIAFLLVKNVPVSRIYHHFLFSSCLTLAIVLVISFLWKISAHMAGLGGIVALLLSLSILLETDLMLYLIISMLVTGITAYARLRINAHDPLQVYSGFLVGFVCVMVVFFS